MGEVVWLPNPPEAKQHGFYGHWPIVGAELPNMAWVVILLLQQYDYQFKIGLSWEKVHIFPLVTN